MEGTIVSLFSFLFCSSFSALAIGSFTFTGCVARALWTPPAVSPEMMLSLDAAPASSPSTHHTQTMRWLLTQHPPHLDRERRASSQTVWYNGPSIWRFLWNYVIVLWQKNHPGSEVANSFRFFFFYLILQIFNHQSKNKDIEQANKTQENGTAGKQIKVSHTRFMSTAFCWEYVGWENLRRGTLLLLVNKVKPTSWFCFRSVQQFLMSVKVLSTRLVL